MKSINLNLEESSALLWRNLVEDTGLNDSELKKGLQEIYKKNIPNFAEILINPYCSNKCKHCIYPSDYHCYNKTLEIGEWEKIISDLYKKLEFRHFIFGGRALNKTILKIVKYINDNFDDCKVGLIADGPAIKKHYDELSELKIDHLDISIDGLKETHDKQRNYSGSFDITVEQIKKLTAKDGTVAKGRIGKLSILATLTTINKDDILPMIKYFNSELGLQNFFITPVAICEGYRPDKSVSAMNFFIAEFCGAKIIYFNLTEDK